MGNYFEMEIRIVKNAFKFVEIEDYIYSKFAYSMNYRIFL